MKPVEPPEPGRLVIFAKDQPQYNQLPARVYSDSEGTVRTKWQLDENERMAILDGACIELTMLTFGAPLQPVRISVEGTNGTFIEIPKPKIKPRPYGSEEAV